MSKTFKFHRLGMKRAITLVLDKIESIEEGEWVDTNESDGKVIPCTILNMKSGKVYSVKETVEEVRALIENEDVKK